MTTMFIRPDKAIIYAALLIRVAEATGTERALLVRKANSLRKKLTDHEASEATKLAESAGHITEHTT